MTKSNTRDMQVLQRKVEAFAALMLKKLEDDKKGGAKADPADLMDNLCYEMSELEVAVCKRGEARGKAIAKCVADVGLAAANVAIVAMMVADVCGALPNTTIKHE